MGIFTLEKVQNLYWLGRYIERTQITLKLFLDSFDKMIDGNVDEYKNFCKTIGIPDVYGSKKEFVRKYPFDSEHAFSIVSNVNRAFDNAIVMRDYLGSETLSYMQMVVYEIASADMNEERTVILMQFAIDHIFAFWGCLDDMVDDDETRSIVKAGKYYERLDLHLRMKQLSSVLKKDFMHLESRLDRAALKYDKAVLHTIEPMLFQDDINYKNALSLLHKLIKI